MGDYRLATIDIGTNTALLLISEWENNSLKEIFNGVGYVRLGEGLDASGTVGDGALLRLESVLRTHMKSCKQYNVAVIQVTGTSASRDARNSHRIRDLVRQITGSDLRILSGQEESEVTFEGAVCGLKDAGVRPVPGPGSELTPTESSSTVGDQTPLEELITVIDVGGGSTEFVQGQWPGKHLAYAKSLNMGSVRMTERYFTSLPVPKGDLSRARFDFKSMMSRELSGAKSSKTCIGASGTAVLLGVLQEAQVPCPASIGSVRMCSDSVADWANRLCDMDSREVLALNPTKMRGREDVFPAGVVILEAAMRFLNAKTLLVSPFGVRHGVAIRYFKESK